MRTLLPNHRKKYSQAEIDTIKRLVISGVSLTKISSETGRSVNAILSLCGKEGINFSGRKAM